jgi:hypothetical protein
MEVLRPNVTQVLYTLEVNSFRDGLLVPGDQAGAGLMLARMAGAGRGRSCPSLAGFARGQGSCIPSPCLPPAVTPDPPLSPGCPGSSCPADGFKPTTGPMARGWRLQEGLRVSSRRAPGLVWALAAW